MAVTTALLTASSQSSANATTFDTASVSFTSGAVGSVFIVLRERTGATTPSLTGGGFTWTHRASINYSGASHWILYYTGVGTPSAGVLTLTAEPGEDWDHAIWHVYESTGGDTGTPLVAANTMSSALDSSSDTHTITYAQAITAGNACLAGFGWTGGGGSATPKTGWTEGADTSIVSQCFLESQYRADGDTTAESVAPSTGYTRIGIAVELTAAAGGGSTQPIRTYNSNRKRRV